MRKTLSLIIFVCTSTFFIESKAADLENPEVIEWAKQSASRCAPSEHPVIYSTDFGWGLNFLETADLFTKMYSSPKRLQHRFYFDQEKGFLGKISGADNSLSIPLRFVYSIKKHIESALSLEYAQWVIFPDMGHSHFFIHPQDLEKYIDLPSNKRMEGFINSPRTKMLYHTLEQIQVMDENKVLDLDPWTQWRYYTRNILGGNEGKSDLEIHKNLTESYNTVRDYKDYRYWSGVNISANQNGCFAYEHQGKTYYFDVSFYDLAYNASGDEY